VALGVADLNNTFVGQINNISKEQQHTQHTQHTQQKYTDGDENCTT
jgi:hypothetical protein